MNARNYTFIAKKLVYSVSMFTMAGSEHQPTPCQYR